MLYEIVWQMSNSVWGFVNWFDWWSEVNSNEEYHLGFVGRFVEELHNSSFIDGLGQWPSKVVFIWMSKIELKVESNRCADPTRNWKVF